MLREKISFISHIIFIILVIVSFSSLGSFAAEKPFHDWVKPVVIERQFIPREPTDGRDDIPRDEKGDGTILSSYHSGLEGTNYIIIEIGTHVNAGSSVSEIQFKVGDSFTIHLLGGAAYFVPGNSLQYNLPGTCSECYKYIPPDDWDNIRLETTSSDGIQLHRVALVKSYETLLDEELDTWLDKHYQKVIDFHITSAITKWEDLDYTRVTDLYYAVQDLGQTGAIKYVSSDVAWCSEFTSYMIRKNGLNTPTGSIGTNDMKNFFQSKSRYYTPADVEGGVYNVKPGDYMSLWSGGHSVLFVAWKNVPSGQQPEFNEKVEFYTIEGNCGNSVRTKVREWDDVDFVGRTQ
ncbi:MAG: hypothetical protein ACMUJM_14870 [bacterium]